MSRWKILIARIYSLSSIGSNITTNFSSNTYLPLRTLLKLELSLLQIPLPRFRDLSHHNSSFNPSFREWSLNVSASSDQFDILVRQLLPKFMPRSFLEDYANLKFYSNQLHWPKYPHAIFTSQLHFTDEVFKLWSATKSSTGTSLIIGEHGGLGVGLLNGTHRYEVSIADTYLSTGWTSSTQPKIVPVGHFRRKYSKASPHPSSKALLICCNMPRFSFDIRSMVLSSQTLEYFDDQFVFLDSLPHDIKKNFLSDSIQKTMAGIKKKDGLITTPTSVLPSLVQLFNNILPNAVSSFVLTMPHLYRLSSFKLPNSHFLEP